MINKIRMIGEVCAELNGDVFIVKTGDIYKLVKGYTVLEQEYTKYFVLADRILVMLTGEDKIHIYNGSDFIKCIDKTQTGYRIKLALELHSLINNVKAFNMNMTTNARFSDDDFLYVVKRKMENKFFILTLMIERKLYDIVYNNEGKEVCSFKDGYSVYIGSIYNDIVMSKSKRLIAELSEVNIEHSEISEKAKSRFNADTYVLINTNGEVTFASNSNIHYGTGANELVCDGYIYICDGDKVEKDRKTEVTGW